MDTRTEYRALIQRPWVHGWDDPKAKKDGYIQEWKSFVNAKDEMLYQEIRASVETWAFVVKWQKRVVTVGDWEDD